MYPSLFTTATTTTTTMKLQLELQNPSIQTTLSPSINNVQSHLKARISKRKMKPKRSKFLLQDLQDFASNYSSVKWLHQQRKTQSIAILGQQDKRFRSISQLASVICIYINGLFMLASRVDRLDMVWQMHFLSSQHVCVCVLIYHKSLSCQLISDLLPK